MTLSPAPQLLHIPEGPGELFRAFTSMSLQGFGGVLAVAQREIVERRRWLTREQFVELLSIGQLLPGPNICNVALMIGDRFHGWRGAAAALGGLLAAPLAIVLVLAALYARFGTHPVFAGALRGMSAVTAGLVLATALKLATSLRHNPLGWRTCAAGVAATIGSIAVLRWPLVGVVVGLGGTGIAIAWRHLGRADRAGGSP